MFMNPKCSCLFDFLSEVLTYDCVVHENGKTDESQKFNAKRGISTFKYGYLRNRHPPLNFIFYHSILIGDCKCPSVAIQLKYCTKLFNQR